MWKFVAALCCKCDRVSYAFFFCLICCCSACVIIAGTILTRCIICSDNLFADNAVKYIPIHMQQKVSIAYSSVFLLNPNYINPWKLLRFFSSHSKAGAAQLPNRNVAFDWLCLNKLLRRHVSCSHTRFMCENKYLLHVGRGLPQSGPVQFSLQSVHCGLHTELFFSLGVKKTEVERWV